MAKHPVAGTVKTRLARDIGTARATYFYRHTLQSIVKRLSRDPRWQTLLAVSPDKALYETSFPPHVSRIVQGTGDLGQRMQRVFDLPILGPIIIIGTDIPELTTKTIANAFKKLSNNDAVIGPCDDGGYWLIGQKRFPKVLEVFDQVRWSTENTCQDTLRNLQAKSVGELEFLTDIDDGQDYEKFKSVSGRVILPNHKS